MMPKTETSGDYAAEEWSTPANWEDDPAIKAERRIRSSTECYWFLYVISDALCT